MKEDPKGKEPMLWKATFTEPVDTMYGFIDQIVFMERTTSELQARRSFKKKVENRPTLFMEMKKLPSGTTLECLGSGITL